MSNLLYFGLLLFVVMVVTVCFLPGTNQERLRTGVVFAAVLLVALVLAWVVTGNTAQAAPVADAFPPCPPTDLEGRAISDSGLTKARRLYCTFGLANPCPTYWDSEATRWTRLPDGRVKCVYFKPAIGTG